MIGYAQYANYSFQDGLGEASKRHLVQMLYGSDSHDCLSVKIAPDDCSVTYGSSHGIYI